MKKTIFSILITAILISVSCTHGKRSGGNNLVVEYQINSSYILVPIEEKAPKVKIKVCIPDSTNQSVYDVHLAVDEIDYWVSIDVKKLKGKKISLEYIGLSNPTLGINEIKQSDRFEFNFYEPYRPIFHYSPEHGWMNDPNGMVYLDGEYHLFYQYNPYGSMWGNMHWGHAVSTDLVSWTYLQTAIAPDSIGEIFSGSIVVDANNTAGFGKDAMVAIYTSAGKTQSQSIAYSTDKGRTFTKYTHNPVLPNQGVPDFRDPKVSWNEASKQWVMALATKQTVTFYGSSNLTRWKKLSEFGQGLGSHAGVWECPDLFPLTYQGKTKWVLLVSMNPGAPNGGSGTQYFIGSFDGKTFKADLLPYPLWFDYGRDNYAGVTFSNIPSNDGRRIFMGWMSNWDYAEQVPSLNFRSATTLPRQLSLSSNGKHIILKGFPTKEVYTLRGESRTIPNQIIRKEFSVKELLPQNKGSYEIEMTLKPQQNKHFGFELKNSKAENLRFTFDLNTKRLSIDREKSGKVDFNAKFKAGSTAPLIIEDSYRVRLLVDKSSAEIFINEGEIAMTTLLFPTEIMNTLHLFSEEGNLKVENITIYNIK